MKRLILSVILIMAIAGGGTAFYWGKLPDTGFLLRSVERIAENVEAGSSEPEFSTSAVSEEYVSISQTSDNWCLILVNKDHPIPADYEVPLLSLSNGEQVDERIYPDLQAMFDAARSEGLQLFVAAGYRTEERQRQLMEEAVQAYENEGYEESAARQQAEKWVAVPGTSEHQLGLAVDINADTQFTSSDQVYNWLLANAPSYGFIKRYPEDKSKITGISNEPWHYRYVGREAAEEMTQKGLCLEEYLSR